MPQHAKRIKIRRKALRQPDEFETLTAQTVAWVSEHRGLAGGSLAVLVAVGLAVLGVARWRGSQADAAAGEFRAAYAVFTAGRFAEAVNGFEDVARDYPSTPHGRLAALYRGHALARQGDAKAAAAAYTEYLATSPRSTSLRQEALTDLGRAQEATGDGAAALGSYTQASGLSGPFERDSLLGAARLQEAAGRTAEAQEIYARLLKDATDADLRAFLVSKVPPGTAKAADQPAKADAAATDEPAPDEDTGNVR